ncbi:CRISPR-associated endonuclease Cas1 [Hydrogenophaga sp. NH-16]|uniref:CRISPR-associated endonuclease Cas1 n=1 Tax=Hydrogenophaga sp. NH-16 TaxID=2184519 RepID=UPI000FDB547B|nr:CRISPR-associated endonuclease Cas1 [Hydrogenophaga sp. NH-16]
MDFPINAADLLQAWEGMLGRIEKQETNRDVLRQWQDNPQAVCGELSAQLKSGAYRQAPLQPMGLPRKGGGVRVLLVPQLADRVVQAALARKLSTHLDPRFHPSSFAYRPGRGAQQACALLRTHLSHTSDRFVLHADIANCFDDIDHDALIKQLALLGLWKNQTAWLLRQFLRSLLQASPSLGLQGISCLYRGLPQGSPLSPLLSNVVLDTLDRALANQKVSFVRYADDFIVVAETRAKLQSASDAATHALTRLGLALNPKKTGFLDTRESFTFLGQRFQLADKSPLESPATTTAPTSQMPTSLGQSVAGHKERNAFLDDEETESNDPLLRTLYLLEPNTTLDRDAHQLLVLAPGQDPLKIPGERLHQVMSFGATHITSGAISLCLEMGIPVMLLAGRGRHFGVIDPLKIDNLNTQRAQFRVLDQPEQSICFAKGMIEGKLANQLALLRRWHRHRPPSDPDAIRELYDGQHMARRNALRATSAGSLRGIEGAAASTYWRAIRALLAPEWKFDGRRRQPPPDPVNSLLSYGYTLLYYNLLTLVSSRGLNPYAGFYHAPRSGHHALVSDLMEEFRGPVVDALVMDMVQNGRIKPDEFTWPEDRGEACLMSVSARRRFIHALEKKLNTPQRHAAHGLWMDWRRIMDGQILHLVQVLHGSSSRYQPYIIKA